MINLCLSILVGLLLLFPVTDADLGWHLRYGDYFWQYGKILQANTFSWQLPEYIWANHSWGYDILISLLYKIGSFPLLSLFGSFCIGLTLFITFWKRPTWSISLAAIIFFLVNYHLLDTGLKSSYLSMFFTGFLIFILRQLTIDQYFRWQFVLPGLFLLWSNLHGQFSLGVMIFLLFVLTHFTSKNLKIFLLSFGLTFMNPWNYQLWATALAHLTAPTAVYIYEWMPWEFSQPGMIIFTVYVGLLIYFVLRHRSRVTRFDLIITLGMSLAAFRSRRLIPIALITSLPIFLDYFTLPKRFHPNWLTSLVIVAFISYLTLTLPARQILTQSWSTYCQSYVYCSPLAATFLKTYPLTGKVFNSYSLGSFLIYQVPAIKVAIDGRMTVWHDQNHQYPFLQYYQVIHAKNGALEWLYREQIELVVLQPQFELAEALQNQRWPLIFNDGVVHIYLNPLFAPKSVPKPS